MPFDSKLIQSLLDELESDRSERTRSVNDTDKFGQAICAFANDLPGNGQPGYLIIGADDKTGNVLNIPITDQLLKNLSAIRTDGNLQPQPSMNVDYSDLDGGRVAVVEVQPSLFPPIRYKGRIWVRIGPRKGVANEQDEKILMERRNSQALTFDALPCLRATLDDLDIGLFKSNYLPKAVPQELIEADSRDIKHQMQALGFYDVRYDCPTHAGILMFGNNVERFLPGAYIQYVRFKGKGRGGDILREYKFSGNLMQVLYQLDSFVDTTISNRRPVPVSALREETRVDYPHWATRELLMNAICHRTYDSNGPIQFYEYDDRIEIMNHGNLYGKANPANFPHVNDYRNIVIAEALRVLGFVNRFSRGVQRVEDDLVANGNGLPIFDLTLGTAFKVIEKIAYPKETEISPANETVTTGNETVNTVNETVNLQSLIKDLPSAQRVILQQVYGSPKIRYRELQQLTGFSRSYISKTLSELKKLGYLERQGSDKNGKWVVILESKYSDE